MKSKVKNKMETVFGGHINFLKYMVILSDYIGTFSSLLSQIKCLVWSDTDIDTDWQ